MKSFPLCKSALALMLVSVILFFPACLKEKASEPAWLEIDSIGLTSNYIDQGSASSRFTDAWVFVNSNLVGGFELPCRVPVLAQGSTDLILYPGIQVNGFSGLRSTYLKVLPYRQQINFVPGQTVKINPVFQYDTLALFPLLEDFEGSSGELFIKSPGTSGEYVRVSNSPQTAFEGNACALIRHNGAESTLAQIESLNWMTLPKGGVGIFFEFNFKANSSFVISLLCKPSDGGPIKKIGIVGLNASETWKKIYITLSPTVNEFVTGNQFKPVIGMARQTDIPVQEVFIDNIKVLY